MEPQKKMDTPQFIIDRLQDIQQKAEANSFTAALDSMKEVKAADPKNIYLIAIEKQIAKLSDPALQPENRSAIIKSLSPMIDRAISDFQRHATIPKVDETQKVQKEAALEKLKGQYFQRADDYVEKKDYQRALEEIRRIYIIEPGSVVAQEYEKKIEQLSALHTRSESPDFPTDVEKESEKVTPTVEKQKGKEPVVGKSNSPKIFVIAAAAVIILAIGTWLILSKGSTSKPGDQELVQQPALSQENTPPTAPVTTTPAAHPAKEPDRTAELSKQPVKNQKTTPEIKPVTSEQKPVQTPASIPPARAQTPAAQQPTPQPVVNTPPPQPAQPQTKEAESTPAPMPFVAIESQPEIIKREPAQYPEIAQKMGLQGRVTVEVTVDAQGKPIQAKVVKSSSEVFNDAAVEAVMKYVFKPAMMSTGPITSKVSIPIDFRMKR